MFNFETTILQPFFLFQEIFVLIHLSGKIHFYVPNIVFLVIALSWNVIHVPMLWQVVSFNLYYSVEIIFLQRNAIHFAALGE